MTNEQSDEFRSGEGAFGAARQVEESTLVKSRAFDDSLTANSIADPNRILTEANQTFLRVWGYLRMEEVVGKAIAGFFMDPDDAAAIFSTLDDAGYWQGEFTARRRDGTTFTASGLATVVRDGNGKLIGYQSSVLDITGSKLAEQSLRSIHRHHQTVLETAMDGFARVDIQGRFVEVNDVYCRMSGYSARELLGMSVSDIEVSQSAAEIAATTRNVRESGSARFESRHRHKDGSVFDVEVNMQYQPEEGGQLVAFIRDISGRKRVEQALEDSEIRYREIFELAVDGFLHGAPDGTISGANLQMQKLTGRSLDQLLNQHVSVLFDPAELNTRPLRFDLLDQSETVVVERNLLRADGVRVPVEMHSKRMPDGTYQSIYRDITKRRQAENALRQSEALLSATQSLSKVGGWVWDVELQKVFWTEETYRIHDFAMGSMGGELQEYLVKSLDCVDEPYRPMVRAAFQRCCEQGDSYDIEYSFTTGAGRHLWIRTTAHALRDERARIVKVVGTLMDITERKQTELELREWNTTLEQRVADRTLELQDSEARFRHLANATFEGIAISEGGILKDCNLQLGRMHGYEPAEMLGRPVADFISPESRAAVAERLKDDNEAVYELVAMRKDGSTFPAEVHIRMGVWMGRSTRIAALRDLTEIKQATARLRVLQAELMQAQRLALTSEISAGIIHQLGQPLSAIGANITAMVKLKAGELQDIGALDIVRDIEANVIHMRKIAAHLRALANPTQPNRRSIDINAIVSDALPLLREKAERCGIRIVLDLDANLPSPHADPVQISQAILNLVGNALDAAEDCPPERREVWIATRVTAGGAVEVTTRDAGAGLSPDTLACLFTPFFTTKPNGLGIGLRLSQTIVEAHGGSIEGFNNPDGVGATFRLVLPACIGPSI